MKSLEVNNRFEEEVIIDILLLDDGKHVKLSFSNITDEPVFNYSTHKGKEKLESYLSKSFLPEAVNDIVKLLN